MSDIPKAPYKQLGSHLRLLRERHHESVAEVSGAVEIEATELDAFETGGKRPSEDILILLINHFNLSEKEADKLMRLAGYDDGFEEASEHERTDSRSQAMMVMLDPRVMYSDSVEVVANQQGIVLNFSQANGIGGQPLTVSRIGMSREEAKVVMGLLHQVLYNLDNPTNPRRLDDGTNL